MDSGRTVVVTIHQPRSKVFHMFDKILFLSEGKVAFFGSPLKVFEFINNSLRQQVMVGVHKLEVVMGRGKGRVEVLIGWGGGWGLMYCGP